MTTRLLCVLLLLPAAAAHAGAQPPRTDTLGDPLPPGAIARLGTTRLLHSLDDCPLVVAFSPDGRMILSVGIAIHTTIGSPRLIQFWDAATGKELHQIKVPNVWPASVSCSPDGARVAVGAERATFDLSVWDVTTAKQVWQVSAHRRGTLGTRFVDGGKTLVSMGGEGTVCWWDAATGKKLRTWDATVLWPEQPGRRRFIHLWDGTFSPDGKVLAINVHCQWESAGKEKEGAEDRWALVVLGLDTGKEIWQVPEVPIRTTPLSFSPDGKRLALDLGEKELAVYETATGKLVKRLPRSTEEENAKVGGLALGADGRTLAVGLDGLGVVVWDVDAGKRLRTFTPPPNPLPILLHFRDLRVALAPDGKRVATVTRQRLWLWDVATGEAIPGATGHDGPVTHLLFSADGRELLSAERWESRFTAELLRWDTQTWKRRARRDWKGFDASRLMFWSPNYRLTICCEGDTGELFVRAGATKNLCKLEVTYKDWKKNWGKNTWGILSRNNHLAVLNAAEQEPGKAWLLDLTTGKRRCSLPGDVADLEFAFGPDDRTVAWSNKDGTIHVADAATGKVVWRLGAPRIVEDRQPRPALTFSNDGRFLASWQWERREDDLQTAHVWDVVSGKEFRRLACQGAQKLVARGVCLAFAPDGRTLAVGGMGDENEVQVWEILSARVRLRLSGHRGPVTALAYSPDGRLLASGSEDTTILIWDLLPNAKGTP
jgi:WD40 repeat protein